MFAFGSNARQSVAEVGHSLGEMEETVKCGFRGSWVQRHEQCSVFLDKLSQNVDACHGTVGAHRQDAQYMGQARVAANVSMEGIGRGDCNCQASSHDRDMTQHLSRTSWQAVSPSPPTFCEKHESLTVCHAVWKNVTRHDIVKPLKCESSVNEYAQKVCGFGTRYAIAYNGVCPTD